MSYLKLILTAAVAVSAFGLAPKPVSADEKQNFNKSIVMIRSVKQDFDYVAPWKQKPMSQGIGTGFVISGKKILTNAHNVSNIKYLEVKKENLPRRYLARVAFIAHDCDMAIVSVDDESFFDDTAPLELAGIPKVNTTVSTYGFPIGGRHISVTEGVVSRIQVDLYAHSRADSHLVIQTDAAINPGNSGGPVLQNGKVVGVAFQGMRQAENIGYMIPTTVVRHFLADVADGEYDGFGSLGVSLYAGLHSHSYRAYLKVPPNEDGVVVVRTMMHSSVESILQPSDVLVKIDDYNIDNDGMVRIYGPEDAFSHISQNTEPLTLHLSEVVETKQIGETAQLSFYRDGKLMKETATVALNRPILEYARQFDRPPRYVCFAGLTFVPITRNYLETWGREWVRDIPYYLRYLFNNSMQLNTDRERREYVVLARIMADKINAYSERFINKPLDSINGTNIWSLDDAYEALKNPIDDFHIIDFFDSERSLILDAKTAQQRQQIILKKYQIPAEAKLENQL
jgi:S1-C subfamily serine protease